VSVADRSFATIALLAYSIVERTFTKFRVEALRKYPFLSGVHTRVLAAEQPYPRLHDKRHELRYFMQVREGWRASTPIFGTYHSVSASRASGNHIHRQPNRFSLATNQHLHRYRSSKSPEHQ
jgi:hypothetical protein